MPGFVVYIKRHLSLSSFCESRQRQPSIATHRRDYEDCKQILTLSLIHTHTLKRPARLQPGESSEDLPYGQSGIRRLSACIRYAPAFCQSSSIDNSLRSIKKIWSGDFRLFPPANFANSAILPTDKISTFFMQNFLPQKPKDSTI